MGGIFMWNFFLISLLILHNSIAFTTSRSDKELISRLNEKLSSLKFSTGVQKVPVKFGKKLRIKKLINTENSDYKIQLPRIQELKYGPLLRTPIIVSPKLSSPNLILKYGPPSAPTASFTTGKYSLAFPQIPTAVKVSSSTINNPILEQVPQQILQASNIKNPTDGIPCLLLPPEYSPVEKFVLESKQDPIRTIIPEYSPSAFLLPPPAISLKRPIFSTQQLVTSSQPFSSIVGSPSVFVQNGILNVPEQVEPVLVDNKDQQEIPASDSVSVVIPQNNIEQTALVLPTSPESDITLTQTTLLPTLSEESYTPPESIKLPFTPPPPPPTPSSPPILTNVQLKPYFLQEKVISTAFKPILSVPQIIPSTLEQKFAALPHFVSQSIPIVFESQPPEVISHSASQTSNQDVILHPQEQQFILPSPSPVPELISFQPTSIGEDVKLSSEQEFVPLSPPFPPPIPQLLPLLEKQSPILPGQPLIPSESLVTDQEATQQFIPLQSLSTPSSVSQLITITAGQQATVSQQQSQIYPGPITIYPESLSIDQEVTHVTEQEFVPLQSSPSPSPPPPPTPSVPELISLTAEQQTSLSPPYVESSENLTQLKSQFLPLIQQVEQKLPIKLPPTPQVFQIAPIVPVPQSFQTFPVVPQPNPPVSFQSSGLFPSKADCVIPFQESTSPTPISEIKFTEHQSTQFWKPSPPAFPMGTQFSDKYPLSGQPFFQSPLVSLLPQQEPIHLIPKPVPQPESHSVLYKPQSFTPPLPEPQQSILFSSKPTFASTNLPVKPEQVFVKPVEYKQTFSSSYILPSPPPPLPSIPKLPKLPPIAAEPAFVQELAPQYSFISNKFSTELKPILTSPVEYEQPISVSYISPPPPPPPVPNSPQLAPISAEPEFVPELSPQYSFIPNKFSSELKPILTSPVEYEQPISAPYTSPPPPPPTVPNSPQLVPISAEPAFVPELSPQYSFIPSKFSSELNPILTSPVEYEQPISAPYISPPPPPPAVPNSPQLVPISVEPAFVPELSPQYSFIPNKFSPELNPILTSPVEYEQPISASYISPPLPQVVQKSPQFTSISTESLLPPEHSFVVTKFSPVLKPILKSPPEYDQPISASYISTPLSPSLPTPQLAPISAEPFLKQVLSTKTIASSAPQSLQTPSAVPFIRPNTFVLNNDLASFPSVSNFPSISPTNNPQHVPQSVHLIPSQPALDDCVHFDHIPSHVSTIESASIPLPSPQIVQQPNVHIPASPSLFYPSTVPTSPIWQSQIPPNKPFVSSALTGLQPHSSVFSETLTPQPVVNNYPYPPALPKSVIGNLGI